MPETEVRSVPPAPHIRPVENPQNARELVETLNQNFQELARHQRETYEAAGVEASQGMTEQKAAIDKDLTVASEAIRKLDTEVQRLQEAARQRAVAANAGREAESHNPDDPRETHTWTAGFDAYIRGGGGILNEDQHKALAQGNAWHAIVDEASFTARTNPDWSPVNAVTAGGLQSTFGPGAGVWVRPTFDNAITKRLIEFSPIRRFARITPIGGPEFVGYIRTANRDTIEQTGEYGTSAQPTQQTQMDRYEERRIRPYTYWARPALSTEILEDSAINLENELQQDIALDFAVDEASNFTTGSGANEPSGYASDTGVGGVPSRAAGELDHHDLTNLMLSLRPFYRGPGAAYAFSTEAFAQAILEEDGNGRRLWQPSNTVGLPSLLNGFPYWEATEQAAVATAAKPVFFANWPMFYRIVDRRGTRSVRDDITTPGLVILNLSRRYGGRIWLHEAGKALTIA